MKKINTYPMIWWWQRMDRKSKIHIRGKKAKTVCGISYPVSNYALQNTINAPAGSPRLYVECKNCLRIKEKGKNNVESK